MRRSDDVKKGCDSNAGYVVCLLLFEATLTYAAGCARLNCMLGFLLQIEAYVACTAISAGCAKPSGI